MSLKKKSLKKKRKMITRVTHITLITRPLMKMSMMRGSLMRRIRMTPNGLWSLHSTRCKRWRMNLRKKKRMMSFLRYLMQNNRIYSHIGSSRHRSGTRRISLLRLPQTLKVSSSVISAKLNLCSAPRLLPWSLHSIWKIWKNHNLSSPWNLLQYAPRSWFNAETANLTWTPWRVRRVARSFWKTSKNFSKLSASKPAIGALGPSFQMRIRCFIRMEHCAISQKSSTLLRKVSFDVLIYLHSLSLLVGQWREIRLQQASYWGWKGALQFLLQDPSAFKGSVLVVRHFYLTHATASAKRQTITLYPKSCLIFVPVWRSLTRCGLPMKTFMCSSLCWLRKMRADSLLKLLKSRRNSLHRRWGNGPRERLLWTVKSSIKIGIGLLTLWTRLMRWPIRRARAGMICKLRYSCKVKGFVGGSVRMRVGLSGDLQKR